MQLIFFSSLPTDLSRRRNYSIINNFTKTSMFIITKNLGDGVFSLLRNVQQQKYMWVILKHVYNTFQPIYLIYSCLHREWRQTYPQDGDVSPQKNVVLHNGKMYWVHIHVISRVVPICSHLLYQLEVVNNKWGFHIIHQSRNTRSVCLAVHSKKLIFFRE